MDSIDWAPVLEFLPWQSFGRFASASKAFHSQGSDFARLYFQQLIGELFRAPPDWLVSTQSACRRARYIQLLGKYLFRLSLGNVGSSRR